MRGINTSMHVVDLYLEKIILSIDKETFEHFANAKHPKTVDPLVYLQNLRSDPL